jgi:hypothetical protein
MSYSTSLKSRRRANFIGKAEIKGRGPKILPPLRLRNRKMIGERCQCDSSPSKRMPTEEKTIFGASIPRESEVKIYSGGRFPQNQQQKYEYQHIRREETSDCADNFGRDHSVPNLYMGHYPGMHKQVDLTQGFLEQYQDPNNLYASSRRACTAAQETEKYEQYRSPGGSDRAQEFGESAADALAGLPQSDSTEALAEAITYVIDRRQ